MLADGRSAQLHHLYVLVKHLPGEMEPLLRALEGHIETQGHEQVPIPPSCLIQSYDPPTPFTYTLSPAGFPIDPA